MGTTARTLLGRARTTAKTLTQHLFITMEFFGGNGLANHAAGGAYGFLLSAAPMLMIVAFFIIRGFQAAPETAAALLQAVPFMDATLDGDWPALEFIVDAPLGIPALISMLSIFWAGRIFAVSVQRGLKVVFAGAKKRNPLGNNLVTLAIEGLVLAAMLAIILGSRTALRFYGAAGIFQDALPSRLIGALFGSQLFRLAALGSILYLAYRLIPANPPRKIAALWGSVFCVIVYGAAATALGVMLRQPRYNFLYGTLSDLIILLVSVYFFFLSFFLGAQFAAVANSFEALLFLRLRETRSGGKKGGAGKGDIGSRVLRGLFFFTEGKLEKYGRSYRAGDTLMSKGEASREIYFLLDGEVDVLLAAEAGGEERPAGTLKAGAFLGEMSYLLSEGRSATIRARTDVSALALPPALFDAILGQDNALDRSIIENLTRRIKRGNEQIAALSGAMAAAGAAAPAAAEARA